MSNSELILTLIKHLTNEGNAASESVCSKESCKKYHIGEPVIVRCKDAGVHCGILVDYYDRTAILKNSRRLWKWCSKREHSLSGIARHGIHQDKSAIAGPIEEHLILPEFCEIIPFSNKEAYESIKDCEVHNEQ